MYIRVGSEVLLSALSWQVQDDIVIIKASCNEFYPVIEAVLAKFKLDGSTLDYTLKYIRKLFVDGQFQSPVAWAFTKEELASGSSV